MDIIKPYIDRNTGRKMNDSPYTRHLQEVHPIDIDAGYIVKNNIQNVPMSDELQEDELIDVDSERGQVWAAASRVVHDAMYDGVNALTVKAPEGEADFGRFGVEFYGQLEHNFSQMGYNIAKLQGADERTKMALYHLQSEYAELPMFSWNGAKRFAKGLSTDPTTYAGIGTLGLGFLGRAGVKQTTKQGFKEMLRRGITSPYAIAALEGGSYSGLYDYFTQEIAVEADMQDSIDPAQIATSTAIGAAAGPAVVAAGEGIVKGAQKAAPVIRDLFDEAGQAADARIANDTGVKLMSGSDPTDAIEAATVVKKKTDVDALLPEITRTISRNTDRNPKKVARDLRQEGLLDVNDRGQSEAFYAEFERIKSLKSERKAAKPDRIDDLQRNKNLRSLKATVLKAQKPIKESPMFEAWTKPNRERVLNSTYDSDTIDAEARLATVEAIAREAKKRGLEVYYTSKGQSGRAGSRYIELPDGGKVRVSDHELPDTAQRRYTRSEGIGNFADEIIVSDWETSSVDDYLKRILGEE